VNLFGKRTVSVKMIVPHLHPEDRLLYTRHFGMACGVKTFY
jgi:hypothetical protein